MNRAPHDERRASRSGQSLLEMMVALAMISTAFMGIAALLSRSIYLNRVATDETTASYLAAEGIEIMKNIVDFDMYGTGGTAWGTDTPVGLSSPIYNTTTTVGLGVHNDALYFDSSAGTATSHLYQYSAGTRTPFVRKVTVTWPSATEIDVSSTVTWTVGPGASQSVVDEDHFYDWY
ncbi:MAG TPA: hypothetical protein VMT99_01810 [Candidatus Paceibacterota bacterium]|nr:hypothetical protein [Candidatus Paceibacterota bacterium]